MTTTHSKSTIPEYDPKNFYYEPKPGPRVNYEGKNNYQRSRGTLNLGDWAIQGKDWESPRPVPKVKFDEAQNNLEKNQGSMKLLLTGYPDMPVEKKGPRVKREAQKNFQKNKGTIGSVCFTNYGKNEQDETPNPRVFYDGIDNCEKGKGSVGQLFTQYGHLPQSARAIPRVKFEGADILENSRGSEIHKTLHMVPPTTRPKTAYNSTFLW